MDRFIDQLIINFIVKCVNLKSNMDRFIEFHQYTQMEQKFI